MSKSNEAGPDELRRRARKISAFALAAESQGVSSQIDVADVLCLRPSWTPKQAAEFLREHSERIGTSMVLRGMEMLAALIGEDTHVN
jgi:hypothetical protein